VAEEERSPALTYTSYLALDEVLTAQRPRSAEHDEMLFIVIHQVYELWFKQLLHELAHLQRLLEQGSGPQAMHTLRRVLTILKTVVAQIDVLETMTPREFTSFRDRLESASGIEAALTRPSVYDHYLRYLVASGYAIPPERLERDVTAPVEPSRDVQLAILAAYRDNGEAAEVSERMVDMDEGVQEWRYRHVKMVERTIGDKPGTGGSAGVAYLQRTVGAPLFPDLWAVRSEL
jgi:tryptophan 2,3-dioxygenase